MLDKLRFAWKVYAGARALSSAHDAYEKAGDIRESLDEFRDHLGEVREAGTDFVTDPFEGLDELMEALDVGGE